MQRRDVCLAMLAGAVAKGAPGQARRTRAPARLGVLLPVPGNEPFLASLLAGLRDAGWADEKTRFTLDVRSADGTVESFRQLGRELAAVPVDVLVTASTAAASALAEVTTAIPIVFLGTFDPVAAGLVTRLDRPGGNLTGIAGFQADIAEKWVSTLKSIASHLTRFVIFSNPASISPPALAGWKTAASRRAAVGEVRVDAVQDVDRILSNVAADARAGMIVVPHTFPFANRKAVVEAMARHRVPAIYGIAEMVRSGGLVSYGQNLGAQWRQSATYIDRILRGAKPGDLPVRYATRFDLAINRGAAAALQLAIPKLLIEQADEIVG